MKLANTLGLPTLAICLCAAAAARADGPILEQVKTYAISGKSGIELYASIGQRGPRIGGRVRVIAHTNFKLTWSRKYEPQGGACTLVSARPKLTITYTLPKPAERLPAAVQKRWEIFFDGIRRHELVHGDFIKEMVATIEKTTVGMSVSEDTGCRKIRKAIVKPLSEASLLQRQRSREFDKVEMSNGANIQRLILGLVTER